MPVLREMQRTERREVAEIFFLRGGIRYRGAIAGATATHQLLGWSAIYRGLLVTLADIFAASAVQHPVSS